MDLKEEKELLESILRGKNILSRSILQYLPLDRATHLLFASEHLEAQERISKILQQSEHQKVRMKQLLIAGPLGQSSRPLMIEPTKEVSKVQEIDSEPVCPEKEKESILDVEAVIEEGDP